MLLCESWESGGIESFLHNILLRMDLTGLEVDIVAAQLKDSVFTQALREHGVRFRELSGSQRNLPENHRRFAALLWERRYDVVHLNIFQGMSLYYAHLAKRAGVPVRIAHSHNTDLRQSLTRPLKLWAPSPVQSALRGGRHGALGLLGAGGPVPGSRQSCWPGAASRLSPTVSTQNASASMPLFGKTSAGSWG